MRKNLNTGGMTTVPASRQNIEHRTPYGVRPVNSPVVPVKSNVVGAMKHGGESKAMNRSVKRMAVGGPSGGMDKRMGPQQGQGKAGSPGGRPLPQQPGGKGAPAPGQNMGGQGKGPIPGVGPVPGGFMGGGAGKGTGPGMGPGAGGMPIGPGGPKGPGMRYPMRPGADGMPMGGGMGGMNQQPQFAPGGNPQMQRQFMQQNADARADLSRQSANMRDMGGMGGQTAMDNRAQMAARAQRASMDRDFNQAGYGGLNGSIKPMGPGMLGPQGLPNPNMNPNMGRAPGMKKGGKVSASSYNDMTGGAAGGIGRLEKSSIAAKTKSQKLKKGGKVKGYADGGELSLGDRIALERAGFDPETRMKRSDNAMYGASPVEKADLPAPKRKEASAPIPRPRPKTSNAASVRMDRAPAAEAGSTFDKNRYGDSERGNGPGSYAKPKKNLATRQRDAVMKLARDKGITDPDKIDDMIYRAQNMRKGGKVEAFEGTRKDMSQDKKLAKKRGMSLKAWEKSSADEKHDTQQNMKGLKKGGHVKGCKCMACGGMAKMASGGMSTAQDGMKGALRPKPTAMAKGGKVGLTFSKPLPGTKVSSKKIRATVSTAGANMKKDGMKGQLRAKASGAKATAMMKPLGMTKMAKGGKVRGAGIAQRGTKFIGEV